MSEALRSLLAEFVVNVDKAGELAKGNEAVTALKARLGELVAEFAKVKVPAQQAAKAAGDVFARAAQTAQRNLQAISASQLGGRADNSGFGALAGLANRPQQGPVLPAGVAKMRAAEQAAAAYAQTLRGKLAGAVAQVRAGFNGGGGSGGGPGLLASLTSVKAGLIGLGVGAAAHGVKRLVDGIGDIRESAQRLGVTTGTFQRLRVLAEQNGTSVGALGTAFRNLANSAVQPTKQSEAAFTKLGVSVKDAQGQFKTTDDLFFEVSAALADVGNETERSALAQDLLGRSAQELKPIFAAGRVEIDKQRQALAAMNVLSDETIAQADDLSDSWKAVGPSLLAAAEPLLQLLLPALKWLTESLTKGVEVVGKFLKQTDFLAVGLTGLAVALTTYVIPGLGLMIALGGGATRVLFGMAGAAASAAVSFARFVLPLLFIEDFIGFLNGSDSVIGRTLDALFGKGASTAVIDALAKAWELLASSVKIVLEALHLWNPDDADKAQQERANSTWQGSNFQRLFQNIGDAFATMGAAGAPGGQFGMAGGMPMPGPSPKTSQNMSVAPTVTVGDNVVNISMAPTSSASQIASTVGTELQSNRDAILSAYPE
jgi:hypothetical protein